MISVAIALHCLPVQTVPGVCGGRCVENRLASVSSCASGCSSHRGEDDHEYHVQELFTGDVNRAFLSCAPFVTAVF